MAEGLEKVREKIRSFQKKYYLDLFIRGLILTLSIIVVYFLTAALIEHTLWLNQGLRLLLFIFFFATFFFCVFKFLRDPIRWWLARKGLNEENSAKVIGSHIPDVKDRLLNLIQLSSLTQNSDLAEASIRQTSNEFAPISFESVIDLRHNKKYLKFLGIPVAIVSIILIVNQQIITQSTDRIVHFNEKFSPSAPFHFKISKPLIAFYNEDYTLELNVTGKALPDAVYINENGQRLKMQGKDGLFSYTFENLQNTFHFQFEAAGFFSETYDVIVLSRPELITLKVDLEYPRYIHKKNQSLSNTGNLEIPEGTTVTWNLQTSNAEKANIRFFSDGQFQRLKARTTNSFSYQRNSAIRINMKFCLRMIKAKTKRKLFTASTL